MITSPFHSARNGKAVRLVVLHTPRDIIAVENLGSRRRVVE